MIEEVTTMMRCSGCRRDTPHAFIGAHEKGLIRYQCQPCGRTKLLTVKEERA